MNTVSYKYIGPCTTSLDNYNLNALKIYTQSTMHVYVILGNQPNLKILKFTLNVYRKLYVAVMCLT